MRSTISVSSGKRPSDFLEKIVLSSMEISNTPPPEATRSLSIPRTDWMVAARLAARGS